MEKIELIGAPQSVFVRTTRLAFEEKGVPYALTAAAPHTARVNTLHPFGKIPVMRHGNFSLFESRAIAAYIDRVFEGPALLPGDARQAAVAEQWISALSTSVFPNTVTYMQANAFPTGADGGRDERVIAQTVPKVARCLEILNTAIAATGHLAGYAFSLADMYLMPLLAYLKAFPESGELFTKSDQLRRYFERHSCRSSFMKTAPPALAELRSP